MTNTKDCRFCGEEILAVAVVCKHCKSDLSASTASAQVEGETPQWKFVVYAVFSVIPLIGIWAAIHFFRRGEKKRAGIVAAIAALVIIAASAGKSDEAAKRTPATSTANPSSIVVEEPTSIVVEEPTAAPPSTSRECGKDISGRMGAMLERYVKTYDGKTDVQKESYEEEIEREVSAGNYCGTVRGKVGEVGTGLTGANVMSGCKTPDGLSGHISVKDLDGVEYRSAIIFMTADQARSHGNLNKGDRISIEAYVYSMSPIFNGNVCAILK